MTSSSLPEDTIEDDDTSYPAAYLDRGFERIVVPELGDLPYRIRSFVHGLTGQIEREAKQLVERIVWNNPVPGQTTVLCLDRAMLRKDVAEMRTRVPMNFPGISVKLVKKAQEGWIPPQWRRQTYITNYLEEGINWSKNSLQRFGTAFLANACKHHKIDAVLAGNMDYWQDESIKLGCQQLGIAFVALCRENYLWPSEAALIRKQYRLAKFTYAGAAVAVASDPTKAALEQTGAFAEGTITTTGWPRFDAWMDRVSINPQTKGAITLLSYADPLYLAPENFSETLSVFIGLAETYGTKIDFVLKVKKANEVDLHMQRFPMLAGSNIRVVADEPIPTLFRRSKAIVGFNSAALLEGLLSGATIVIPTWADSVRKEADTTLHHERDIDRNVASFPQSKDDLRALIESALNDHVIALGNKDDRLSRFCAFSYLNVKRSSSQLVADVIQAAVEDIKRRKDQ